MTTKTETAAILPCPFCGDAPTVGPTRSMHIVECNNAECLVNPDALAAFKHDAIAAWNRRANPQPVSGSTILPSKPTEEMLGAIMGREWDYCGNGMRMEARSRYQQLRKVCTATPAEQSTVKTGDPQ